MMSQYEGKLAFLEEVYSAAGPYEHLGPERETKKEALILNFTKVVSDCRAILLLSKHHLYIQAGILARSTSDACHLMVHLAFAENPPSILASWLGRTGVRHWKLIRAIEQQLGRNLNIDAYAQVRRRLDDFVHGNYEAVRLYPAQVGCADVTEETTRDLGFWVSLLDVFVYSCLMAVQLISTRHASEAERYMNEIAASRGVESVSNSDSTALDL